MPLPSAPTRTGPPDATRLLILGSAGLIRPGTAQPPVLQSKRLLLLSYLVLEGTGNPIRRDKLLALFWPEHDDERARHSLRQAIHSLRSILPAGALGSHGEATLAVEPGAIWCDAFLLRQGATGVAVHIPELYRGDLLDGVHAAGVAPELQEWVERVRVELRAKAREIAWTASAGAESAGDAATAIRLAVWAGGLADEDEPSARRRIALLARLGDRAGALRAYEELSQRLHDELDVAPAPETQALAAEIRSAGGGGRGGELAREVGGEATPATARPQPWTGTERRTPARGRRRALLGIVGMLLLAIAAWVLTNRTEPVEPILAVGHLEVVHRAGGDSLLDAAAVSGVLVTDLSRVVGIQVLSQARVYQFMTGGRGIGEAARRAGATDLLEGRVVEGQGSRLRLELRRVTADRGTVHATFTADGVDLFDAVSAATALVADHFGAAVPSTPIGQLTSRSLVAQRHYQEGLRALGLYDYPGARRAFSSALDEDPAFTAAAYRLVSLSGPDFQPYVDIVARAAAAADSLPDRERFQIRYQWAILVNDPAMLAYAESLAARFPAEPEGRRALASALAMRGAFAEAAVQARRALALDSLLSRVPAGAGSPCRRCEALGSLVGIAMLADSAGMADVAARQLLAESDSSRVGLLNMATVLGWQGRHEEARELLRTRWPPQGEQESARRALWELALKAGDFVAAESLLARDPDHSEWDAAIYFRTRGRYADALREIERGCNRRDRLTMALCDMGRALSLAGLGRQREAAAVLQAGTATAAAGGVPSPGTTARASAWVHALAGVAWADVGDTTRLALAADSVGRHARQSAYGRDSRVHHHLLGLLALARGDTARAEFELRSAIWSLSLGYPRTNLALGRLLMATGRPADAYGILEPAVRGTVSAMGSHATLSELHAMAGVAAHQAGWQGLAERHLRWAARAWEGADPPVRARLDSLSRAAGVSLHRSP